MKQWEDFLRQQELEFGKQTVDRWLKPLKVLRFDACNLYLQAEDSFQLIWFEEYIRPKLKNFVNNNNSKIFVHISSATQPEKQVKKKVEKDTFSLQFDSVNPLTNLDFFLWQRK